MHNPTPDVLPEREGGQPRVSVVIPSWRGVPPSLSTSLAEQTYQDYELVVVAGVSPAARARNEGVARAQAELIVFIDDDAAFGHPRVLEQLVATIQADESIGVAGPSKVLSPRATALQQRIANETPRWVYPVVKHDTESNPPLEHYGYTGITTTCCIIRRSTFNELRGFDETLRTGPEDTEFFYRLRKAGYRFVIPGDCWVYHDPPRSLKALLRKHFQYGVGHALEVHKAPERNMDIIPLDRWYGKLFVLLSPLFFVPSLFVNIYFEPQRHIRVGFRPIKALATYATLVGYTWGWFRGAER